MAVYKVQEDGKAGAGKQVGDLIATGGGTYQITGVNPDGTYKSTLFSDATPDAYAKAGISLGATPQSVSGSPVASSGNQVDQINSIYNAWMASRLAELDAQEEGIDPTFSAARNQAAATQAQQKNAFNEMANARGLGTGAYAQGDLAIGNVFGNAINAANIGEAKARANLNLQRNSVRADADLQRSRAMLEELNRQDTLTRDDRRYQDQMAMEMYNRSQNEQQTAYERIVQQAELLASSGNFSGYKALYGLSDADVSGLESAYRASASQRSVGSTPAVYKPLLTYNQVMDAIDRGEKNPQVLMDYQYYMGSPYNSTGLTDTGLTLQSQLDANRDRGANVSDTILRPLLAAARNGTITEQDFITLMNRYGLNYTDYIA